MSSASDEGARQKRPRSPPAETLVAPIRERPARKEKHERKKKRPASSEPEADEDTSAARKQKHARKEKRAPSAERAAEEEEADEEAQKEEARRKRNREAQRESRARKAARQEEKQAEARLMQAQIHALRAWAAQQGDLDDVDSVMAEVASRPEHVAAQPHLGQGGDGSAEGPAAVASAPCWVGGDAAPPNPPLARRPRNAGGRRAPFSHAAADLQQQQAQRPQPQQPLQEAAEQEEEAPVPPSLERPSSEHDSVAAAVLPIQADRSGEHPAWGVPSPPQLDDSFGELRPGSAASGDTCWYDDVELPMLERLPV